MRTCGAAHAGSSESEKESSEDTKEKELETEQEDNDWDYVDPDEFDEYLDKQMLEDYKRYREQKNKVLTGHVSETEIVPSDESKENSEQAKRTVSGSGKSSIKLEGQAKTSRIEQMVKRFLRKHSKTYRDYDRLTVEEVGQKALTKYASGEDKRPLQDYYKISLDLSDNPEEVVSNERNKIYKADNLPRNIDKKVVLDKIAQSLKLDLSNSKDLAIAKNTVVVAPTPESMLVKVIKRSKKINDFIKNNYENIKKGAFEGKTVSIEFERPHSAINTTITKKGWDTITLYGVLHRADISNVKKNPDGSISLVISDFFDFEYWQHFLYDSFVERYTKIVNNNAYEQQKAGKLTPYLLYIEINISKDELDKMFAQEL